MLGIASNSFLSQYFEVIVDNVYFSKSAVLVQEIGGVGINSKGVVIDSSEQLVKGLWWVGSTMLVARLDHVKRLPMAQLINRATLKQILRDSLRLRRVSYASLALPIVEISNRPVG